MSAKLKPALRRPVDDWTEFRPVEASRQKARRSVPTSLLVVTFLFAVLVTVWVLFKPQIAETVAEFSKAVSEMGQPRAVSSKSRATAAAPARRAARPVSASSASAPENATREPGPFEVYLLDGDRYVRVDSNDRSVLLNLRTGETTWLDSEAATAGRR